ncbi:MAG: hypothetical protein M3Q10_20285, partial [Chloroflexota bacterium]|nr:hypothetical protein [Chloroflexota bacterium]
MPILPTDSRSQWDDELLVDPRVTHLWDEAGTAGRWFADPDNLGLRYPGPVVWDAFLLFDRQARWDGTPSNLVGSGWTVIGSTDKLEAALAPLLATGNSPVPASVTQEPATLRGEVAAVVAAGLANPRGLAFGPD